jgi:uncharacterized protein (TIGR02147 family)
MQELLRPDPRRYQEPRQFLQDFLLYKKKQNSSYSARAWAAKMGFSNHSLLSMLLSGVREIRPIHLKKILHGLDLPPEEREYFEGLILVRNASSEYEQELHLSKLRKLAKDEPLTFLEIEKFRAIANWIHFAVLEMTELKNFKPEPAWISRRLGHKISATEVYKAVERLIILGLLKREKGSLQKVHHRLHAGDKKSSKAIREYHRQVLELATAAIEKQSIEERILHSFCFTVDKAKLPEAEKVIQEFRKKLVKVCGKDRGDDTYQCGIQLFKLTDGMEEAK